MGELDRSTVDPRRGASLESSNGEPSVLKLFREMDRGGLASSSARNPGARADMNTPTKECPRRDYNGSRSESPTLQRLDSVNGLGFWIEDEPGYGSLDALKRRMTLEQCANRSSIHSAIALGARRPHRCALASIEHPELQRGHVRRTAHDATEGVHLTDNCPLGNTTNRGVARHLSDAFECARDETDTCAEAGRSNRGLGASVSSTDDDDVELFLEMLRERHRPESYCRCANRGNNILRYRAMQSTDWRLKAMQQEIPSGQSMLLIRREAYERAHLARAGIDERLNLTPDEFKADGTLIYIGPLPDDTAFRDIIDDLEGAGLVYFDDFFELSGNWPTWIRLTVAPR